MTERSKRRAAARKANKLENKHLTQTAVPRVAAATAQGQTVECDLDEQTPSLTISPAQLAANHANAQHSTGPSSPAGKAISSRNNFRHGLTQTEGDLAISSNASPATNGCAAAP